MKKGIHPEFREVVFKDVSTQFQILTKSAVKSKNTIEIKGQTYPLVTFDVSSASHPFYTGQQRLMDTEGRAEKFRKRYARSASSQAVVNKRGTDKTVTDSSSLKGSSPQGGGQAKAVSSSGEGSSSSGGRQAKAVSAGKGSSSSGGGQAKGASSSGGDQAKGVSSDKNFSSSSVVAGKN